MLRLTLALGLIGSLAGTLQAGTLVPSKEPISASVQRESVDTIEPFYRAYVTAGTEKFAFLMPANFRLAGDPAHGKLQIENQEAGSFISLTFLRSSDDEPAETGKAAYKELLARRYTKARFLDEFSQAAGGHNGQGFDVQWTAPSGLIQRTKALFVPTGAGLMEMTVTTGITNAQVGQDSFDAIFRSFAASVNGQLTVHHMARVN
jgi:hypothetical protein